MSAARQITRLPLVSVKEVSSTFGKSLFGSALTMSAGNKAAKRNKLCFMRGTFFMSGFVADGFQGRNVVPQRRYRGVEGRQRAVGARQHHSAFHGREDELGERSSVRFGRQSISRGIETVFDEQGPAVEVRGQ